MGENTAKEQTYHNFSVFLFNGAGGLVTSQYVNAATIPGIVTTTAVKKVIVLANVGNVTDGIGNLTQLQAMTKDFGTMVPGATTGSFVEPHPDMMPMTGTNTTDVTFTPGVNDTDPQTASVQVQMRFWAAKVVIKSISWNNDGATATDNVYQPSSTESDWGENDNFTISGIYLMNAQTRTHLIADASGYYIPSALEKRVFQGGHDWTAPWTGTRPGEGVGNYLNNTWLFANSYLKTMTPAAGTGANSKALNNIGYWYVFGNDCANLEDPTSFVIEFKWRRFKQGLPITPGVTTPSDVFLTVYHTVFFAEKEASGERNKAEVLKNGNIYNVSIKLNGNFKPANNPTDPGDGGGGDTDPSKPTTSASLTVNVDAATWATKSVNKTFD